MWKPLLGPEQSVYWYILQTHQAAEVAFNRYCKMFRESKELLEKKPNESEKHVQLLGDRNVFFKSGENYEDLRVETLHGVIIDEYRLQHKDLWPMVIRPMLGRHKGWADFLSTPNGYDDFYDLWQKAEANPAEWGLIQAPSTEAWWWTPEEIASAKASMTELEFQQEIMAEFVDLFAGKAYVNFSRNNNIRNETPFRTTDPERIVSDQLPIVLGLDFNLSPMAWTLGQTNRIDWYWFDEIWLKESHTQEASRALVEKLLTLKARGLLRASPNVIVCGDATGKAGQRAAVGQSDYDILLQALKDAGISYENATPDSNPLVKDRVNAVNAKCKSAIGQTHMWVHPQCKNLIYDMERVTWKAPGILDSKKNVLLTHSSDSIGYPMIAITPIKAIKDVGELRVIVR